MQRKTPEGSSETDLLFGLRGLRSFDPEAEPVSLAASPAREELQQIISEWISEEGRAQGRRLVRAPAVGLRWHSLQSRSPRALWRI